MLQPIKLESEQINRLLEMTNTLYGEFISKIEYDLINNYFLIYNTKESFKIHWYELLINHLVLSIYQFGLEEFCLNIECHIEGTLNQHLVDIVYERFEQHIKNIIEK